MPIIEEWRSIEAAPDYEVSDAGRIRRLAGRRLCPHARKDGYVQICLTVGAARPTFLVHRLVCEAFHGPAPSPLHEAAHRDGDRGRNLAENLRWLTAAENAADKRVHGTLPYQLGSAGPRAKVSEEDVRQIRRIPRYNGVLPDLAQRFGLTLNTICTIRTRNGGKWPHIPFGY